LRSLFILVVDDEPLQRRLLAEKLRSAGHRVETAADAREALETARRELVEIALVDNMLAGESGLDLIQALVEQDPLLTPIMVTAFGSIETAVEAMKRGAYDFIAKPVDVDRLLLVLERAGERHKLRREIGLLRAAVDERFQFRNFVALSPRMTEAARLMARAAQSDATVLLTGETGTGKELAARTIHYSSRRKGGPFLPLNLAALPESLMEAELFGAEKGAYTGAHERRIGAFEAADGGTLMLDEIGDLAAHLQVKILRLLQEKEFTRLGSSVVRKADVRIVAATNRDLEALVTEQKFRSDLFYRLNVVRIALPPLRERREDIPPLIDLFLARYARRESKPVRGISAEAMKSLLAHPFPGNIRELENILERAVVFCDGDHVTKADLPVFVGPLRENQLDAALLPLPEKVRRLEIREIRRALSEAGGVKSKAARALGLTERILGYKIKLYNLEDGPLEKG
jgi:DNA-binding NtrC family response regulator